MPRSAASRTAVMLEAPRMEPPEDLTDEQRRDWESITAKFPPEYFGADNSPLLAELCRHMAYSRMLAEELESTRRWKLTTASPEGARRRQIFAQLLRAMRAETQTITMLSLRLRLVSTAFRTRDSARGRGDERLATVLPSSPRPWDQ
jgi:hypothetical protein